MVAGFNRSFSSPDLPATSKQADPHLRSPTTSDPSDHLVSQLEDDIRSVDSWRLLLQHPSYQPESVSWIYDGLAHPEILHASLADLLSRPLNQDCLCRCRSGSDLADRILDTFLRFAGSFRSEMFSVNELQSEAQVAVRRNDLVRLASCTRSMKNTEKQLLKLISLTNREASRSSSSSLSVAMRFTKGIEEAELAGIVREVVNVTASASCCGVLGDSSCPIIELYRIGCFINDEENMDACEETASFKVKFKEHQYCWRGAGKGLQEKCDGEIGGIRGVSRCG